MCVKQLLSLNLIFISTKDQTMNHLCSGLVSLKMVMVMVHQPVLFLPTYTHTHLHTHPHTHTHTPQHTHTHTHRTHPSLPDLN